MEDAANLGGINFIDTAQLYNAYELLRKLVKISAKGRWLLPKNIIRGD